MKEFIVLLMIDLWSFSEVRAMSKLINSESTLTVLILLLAELGF